MIWRHNLKLYNNNNNNDDDDDDWRELLAIFCDLIHIKNKIKKGENTILVSTFWGHG